MIATFRLSVFIGVACLLAAFTAIGPAGPWQIVQTKTKVGGRSECGLAAVNGKLYLIGGDGPAVAVEVFDPATASWTKKATAPIVMHHFQPVTDNNKIYVLDAFTEGGFPDQSPMANVYWYDTQKDSWQQGAEIPVERRRAGAGAAAYQGKLYLVNGIQHGHSSGTTNMFDEYDPKTNRWKPLPDAPHIRDHSMAAVVKDKLYAVGGRNTSYHEPNNFMAFFSKTVLEVDCYDFKTGQWSTLPAKLPLGSGGGTLVNLQNRLYYIGGERATADTPNGAQKETYYLDPATSGQWIQTGNVNKARNGVGGAVLDNKIYIAGGAGGGPGGPPPNGKMAGQPSPRPDSAQSSSQAPQASGGNQSASQGFPQGPLPGNRPPGNGGDGDIALEVFNLK